MSEHKRTPFLSGSLEAQSVSELVGKVTLETVRVSHDIQWLLAVAADDDLPFKVRLEALSRAKAAKKMSAKRISGAAGSKPAGGKSALC